jgi:hypothetical protein
MVQVLALESRTPSNLSLSISYILRVTSRCDQYCCAKRRSLSETVSKLPNGSAWVCEVKLDVYYAIRINISRLPP